VQRFKITKRNILIEAVISTMKNLVHKLSAPASLCDVRNPSRRGIGSRIAILFVAVLGFSVASGLTSFSAPHAEAAGWLKINKYWKGYQYANGDWQFFYNDGRVVGAGNWTVRTQHAEPNSHWSHFMGYSSTKSYVRQPGEWFYRNTIYGTPGPRIYPSL
jgi:hypothetical protein